MTSPDDLHFDLPKHTSSTIKVVGVGGGGNNAINYMYEQGITGVDYVVCNTDHQALLNSPIPNKIQLGASITEGLGAGANPDIGEQAALESIEELKAVFNSQTKMVFITAGMGGGTGTGAAPIIAGIAKEMGILTVAIVTAPFFFEGKSRLEQAEKGIQKLRNNVDSLIVINNNKLRELYGNLGYKTGFAKADEVLSTAAKGIAEVITKNYTINIDLRDAKTVLEKSGTAIMGSGEAEGENKAQDAIDAALDSPLLNDNKITGAKNVLLLILSGEEEITIDEINVINEHIQKEAGNSANIIMGVGEDKTLGNKISVTIIATGFPLDDQKYTGIEEKKTYHTLDEDQPLTKSLFLQTEEKTSYGLSSQKEEVKRFTLDMEEEQEQPSKQVTSQKDEDGFLLFDLEEAETNVSPSPTIPEQQLKQSLPTMQEEEEVEMGEKETKTVLFSLDEIEDTVEDFIDDEEEIPMPYMKEETVFSKEEIQEEHPSTPTNMSEEMKQKIEERRAKLKQFNTQYSQWNHQIDETESIPAYKRQGLDLDKAEKPKASKFYLDSGDEEIRIRPNNFLHDNVD